MSAPMFLDLPGQFTVSLFGMEILPPPVSANQFGRVLQFIVRFRDPMTGLVQDEDGTSFVID
jgi:hypothetical protein